MVSARPPSLGSRSARALSLDAPALTWLVRSHSRHRPPAAGGRCRCGSGAAGDAPSGARRSDFTGDCSDSGRARSYSKRAPSHLALSPAPESAARGRPAPGGGGAHLLADGRALPRGARERARSTSSATSVTPAPALRAVRTPVAGSVALVGSQGQARPVQRPREGGDGGTLGSTARVTRRGARRACGACRPPTTTLSLSAANLKRASQSGRDSQQRRTASKRAAVDRPASSPPQSMQPAVVFDS